MPLDPAVQTLLDTLAAAGQPPMEQLTPVEARAAFAPFADFAGPPEPVAGVRDTAAPGPASDIPVRVYTPSGTGPFPAFVYYHGGGWVLGNLESHDALCRVLANRSGAVVIAAGYRLAPEHKFPAAILRRAAPGDREQARVLLDEAIPAFRAMGMILSLGEAEAMRRTLDG